MPRQIDELYFNCIKIHEYLNELITFIKNNHTIKHLSINNSNITNEDLKKLCEAIKENDTLISLNFSTNYSINNITPICDLILSNNNISALYLNVLYDVDFKPLLECLKINNTIKVFEMYDYNNLLNEFCEMMKINKSITNFAYKNSNKIDTIKFKEVFEINKNITSINLSGNKSDDWTLLTNALVDYKNIINLNFNECNIQDYTPFYKIIKNNSTLKNIKINHHSDDKNDIKMFIDALKTNKTIETIDINGLVIENTLEYLKIVYNHPTLKEINIELDRKFHQIICNVLFSAKSNIANIGYQPCINYEQFYHSKDKNKRLSQFVYA